MLRPSACFLPLWLFLTGAHCIGTFEVFERSCQTPISGFLFCSFSVTKNWDFLKFREWSDSLPGRITTVELYVNCEGGASVHLPWPARARSLKVLDIQGCLIRGFYDEYQTTANYTDSLVDLKITDCVIEENQRDHIDRSIHQTPGRGFVCGQESVVVCDIQNLTWTFPRIPAGPKVHQQQRLTPTYSCNYSHMVYLDETFQYVRENNPVVTYYPVLKVATFSSNNLSHVPEKARNWSSYFPVLEVLDLSNNSISQFYFENPPENHTLYVDLRNNSVVDVPTNMTSYLRESSAVIIDLRRNPIKCSCNLSNFVEYLRQTQRRFPEWHHGTSVNCMTTETLTLVTDFTSKSCNS